MSEHKLPPAVRVARGLVGITTPRAKQPRTTPTVAERRAAKAQAIIAASFRPAERLMRQVRTALDAARKESAA